MIGLDGWTPFNPYSLVEAWTPRDSCFLHLPTESARWKLTRSRWDHSAQRLDWGKSCSHVGMACTTLRCHQQWENPWKTHETWRFSARKIIYNVSWLFQQAMFDDTSWQDQAAPAPEILRVHDSECWGPKFKLISSMDCWKMTGTFHKIHGKISGFL